MKKNNKNHQYTHFLLSILTLAVTQNSRNQHHHMDADWLDQL